MSKPTKPPKPDELPATIDPTALAQVLGGASSDSTGLISALNGLLDSVKQIKTTSQAHGINPQEMMLFMMLMQRQQQQPTVTVATSQPPWWYFR
jgi:hypothetical protein